MTTYRGFRNFAIRTRPRREIVSTSQDLETAPAAPESADPANPDLSTLPGTELTATGEPLQETQNPYRRNSYNDQERRRGFLPALFRALSRRISPPPPTPEEIALLEEEQRRKLLNEKLTKDATADVRNIRASLNALGYCAWTTVDGRRKVTQPVKFDQVLAEPDAVHVHVHRLLPWGVKIKDLTDPDTLDNLSHSCGHFVRARYTALTGLWYTVERGSSTGGVPNHVSYVELIKRLPASAGPLAFPVGIAGNSRLILEDLGRMPHMLVAGTTGGGKTNFLNSILCTLITRTSPERLRLVLVDLKMGLSFSRYIGVPHLMTDQVFCQTGVIEQREQVAALLAWLIAEGEERMKIFRSAHAEDIAHYNRHRKNPLPWIVLVIDEWADMLLTDKKEAENKLVNIISRMRSVGIHVILATQNPNKEVIVSNIKANLPCKVAFSVPNIPASMLIINNGMAVGLQPVGRAILQFRNEVELQTPYMPPELVDSYVAQARGIQPAAPLGSDLTPREIMEWALQHNDGWLTQRALLAQFGGRGMNDHELRDMVTTWVGNEYAIEGSTYRVVDTPNRKGRRLVAVLDQEKNI